MSIENILLSRRSVYQFKSDILPEETIKKCINAAIWAPNHKLTQPWFFWSIQSQSKQLLGQIYAELRATKRASNQPEHYSFYYESALKKFSKIPNIVLVGQRKVKDSFQSKEDYAACSCAIQNFSLMAWEMGIGVQWSTGPIIQDKRVFEMIGETPEKMEIIGALYIGKPETIPKSKRDPIENFYQVI